MQVTVSKEAAQELGSAALWYETEQQGLDARLISAVAFAHFKRLPDYWLGRIGP